MRLLIYYPFFILPAILPFNNAYTCHDINGEKIVNDLRCSQGQSLGCNAGGEGQDCRFCWAIPNDPLCSSASTVSTNPGSATTPSGTACNPPCHNVGTVDIFCDPDCSSTVSLGCNADGQGQDCRFCWADPAKCSVATTISSSTTQNIRSTTQNTGSTKSPTTPQGGDRCSNYPMTQSACTKAELSQYHCDCPYDTYCCMVGNSAKGCSPSKWSQPACSCACEQIEFPVPNCTWEQFVFSPCVQSIAPYYCPTTFGCAPQKFRGCPDICYLTTQPPYPPKPPNLGTYTPSNDLIPQNLVCGPGTATSAPACGIQPDDPNWSHSALRQATCSKDGLWCPKTLDGWEPSIYQCGPTMYKTDECKVSQLQSEECRVAPIYEPPSWAPKKLTETGYCDTLSNCDNRNTSAACVGCCLWDNPHLKCFNYWEYGKGDKCTQVSPRWNWIITTCDTMGGLDFGGACVQNPFSEVNIRYVAMYQLSKNSKGDFVWAIVPDSSLNYNGREKYVDFSKLPTETTIGAGSGPVKSCSGGGGGWNAAFMPYRTNGGTPPAFMFVLSYDKFYNAAWFMLNQRILDGGPATPTCSAMTNCWGEISAGEIDFLETPNLFPEKFKNQEGWHVYRTTSYNAANRCWACNHANKDGSKNIAGCGGEPAATFYNANAETPGVDDAHYWAVVVDARGTTVYKDPVWPGLSKDCAAEQLVNLHPEEPEQQTPCSDPDKTCAIYLPGCVTNITAEMSQIVNGDYSRIPECWYQDWAVHTTCTENWWNLMMDTGQWIIKDPPLFN